MGCAVTINLNNIYNCIAFVFCKQLFLDIMCVYCVVCIFFMLIKWINVVYMFSL